MDLATLPDWISALSTVGAFAAAVVAGVFAARIYRIESERDRISASDRKEIEWVEKRHQAERIATWPEHLAERPTYARLTFQNFSELPVWDVVAEVRQQDHEGLSPLRHCFNFHMLPPSTSPAFPVHTTEAVQFRPNPEVTILFRDAAGVRWKRDAAGILHLVSDRPAPA